MPGRDHMLPASCADVTADGRSRVVIVRRSTAPIASRSPGCARRSSCLAAGARRSPPTFRQTRARGGLDEVEQAVLVEVDQRRHDPVEATIRRLGLDEGAVGLPNRLLGSRIA